MSGDALCSGKGGMRTAFGVDPRAVVFQRNEVETLREHLVLLFHTYTYSIAMLGACRVEVSARE